MRWKQRLLRQMTEAELILLRWKLITDTDEKEKDNNRRHRQWITAELERRKAKEVQDLQGDIQPDGEQPPGDMHKGELHTGEREGGER